MCLVNQYHSPKVTTYRDQMNLHFSLILKILQQFLLLFNVNFKKHCSHRKLSTDLCVFVLFLFQVYIIALLISLKLSIYDRTVYIYSSSFPITSMFHLMIHISGTFVLPTKILQYTVGKLFPQYHH